MPIVRLPDEEQYRLLWVKYGMPEEKAKELKAAGFIYYEIDKASMYAYVAQKPVEDVLELRRENPWMKIELLLGITPQLLHDRELLRKAECAEKWWGISAKLVYRKFMEGYPLHYIRMAYILSKHSDWSVEEILEKRKRSVKWAPWAQENMGIAPEDLKRWIREMPNPSVARKPK